MDEEKDDIKKIQKSIDDILGIESGLAKKRPTLKAKKRELFIPYKDTTFYLLVKIPCIGS